MNIMSDYYTVFRPNITILRVIIINIQYLKILRTSIKLYFMTSHVNDK